MQLTEYIAGSDRKIGNQEMTKNQQLALDIAVSAYGLYYYESDVNWTDGKFREVKNDWTEAKQAFADAMGISRFDAHGLIMDAYDARIAA